MLQSHFQQHKETEKKKKHQTIIIQSPFLIISSNTLMNNLLFSALKGAKSHRFFKSSIALTSLVSSLWVINHYQSSNQILLDQSIENLNSVQVDKNVDPIPLSLKLSTNYQLLAQGTRAVTFLKFKVYALGIYVANDDLYKIPTVLDSKFLCSTFIDTDNSKSHSENVTNALHDKEKSKILISNLLDSNIRLVARICPIRNTDFNHLRDGLVKSILAAGVQDESLADGLQELKDAFNRKGSVPKNNNLFIERLSDGQLQLIYENTRNGEVVELGNVKNPIVSKLLFLQYLSGGLSNDTRENAIQRIAQLV